MNNIIKTLILLLLPLVAVGQRENLFDDMPFFERKAATYQRWLDTIGLGQTLAVEKVQFARNVRTGSLDSTELELFLLFRTTDPDTARSMWKQASLDFERVADRTLLSELFRMFTHKMEIPPAQGNVQIYVSDISGQKIPCFFVWIWEESGVVKDSLQDSACDKAQNFEIKVPSVQVKSVVRGKTIARTTPQSTDEIFVKIIQFMENEFPANKYRNMACDGRYPKITIDSRTDKELIISVNDLCREVLTNARRSLWCELATQFGWTTCNDIKRERLTFRFECVQTQTETRLKCNLVGKFGSGAYVPRKNGYMDMDPDFLDFEEEYALDFKNKLAAKL